MHLTGREQRIKELYRSGDNANKIAYKLKIDSSTVQSILTKVTRYGKAWTSEEINLLKKHHKEGLSNKEIAKKLGRTTTSIRGRLKDQNLESQQENEDLLRDQASGMLSFPVWSKNEERVAFMFEGCIRSFNISDQSKNIFLIKDNRFLIADEFLKKITHMNN